MPLSEVYYHLIVRTTREDSFIDRCCLCAAYDFTGQWSDAVSSGVTVDTTPPTIDQIWLEGTTQYTDSLRSFWEPVEECESEISTLEWGLGSRPGSSDLMEWTQVLEGETSGGYSRDLGVGDGQLVFLSVKVSTL